MAGPAAELEDDRRARAGARSRSSTARRASCATAATRSRSWPSRARFLEVAWLLIHGELPTRGRARRRSRSEVTLPHDAARGLPALLRRAAEGRAPDAGLRGGGRRARDLLPGARDRADASHETVVRLIAKMPTIAAYSYKHSIGQPFMYPRNELDYAANFLHMMFATPCEEYEVDPVVAQGARPAADPARRPRAELLDQHGAPGRQLAARTCSPASRPASARSGARCTAAPTRR